MIALASFALAGCLAVGAGSDYILAKDLAPAFPALADMAPDTPVAPAPFPGVSRIFRVAELLRLAARLAVRLAVQPAPENDICVLRPVGVLDEARIRDAMKKELPEARIEILEFSRQPAPEGTLEFPVTGLQQGPAGGYWHGFVPFGLNHRFAVWAKVKVLVMAARVVAAEELKPGLALDAGRFRMEMREEPRTADKFAASIEEVTGRVARRTIPAGAAIRMLWLEAPHDIVRGETVRVEVSSGGAHLEFEALAQGSGSAGETIRILNPESKKLFPARVEGKGLVSVKGSPSVKGSL
jgi:flagellar basal body P-ring formation protein FlgA